MRYNGGGLLDRSVRLLHCFSFLCEMEAAMSIFFDARMRFACCVCLARHLRNSLLFLVVARSWIFCFSDYFSLFCAYIAVGSQIWCLDCVNSYYSGSALRSLIENLHMLCGGREVRKT